MTCPHCGFPDAVISVHAEAIVRSYFDPETRRFVDQPAWGVDVYEVDWEMLEWSCCCSQLNEADMALVDDLPKPVYGPTLEVW